MKSRDFTKSAGQDKNPLDKSDNFSRIRLNTFRVVKPPEESAIHRIPQQILELLDAHLLVSEAGFVAAASFPETAF
jgi:hypothetical protein